MTTHVASSSLSSSSSSSKLWKYDVFLSFRSEDTRNGFTGHLHAALKDKGYEVYIDEDDLKRGEEIKPELFRAIEESRISIIVFSKNYADSRWCFDELVKIMECKEKPGQEVLPIFYHVDPSHVRKQEGCLARAFQKHEDGIFEEKYDKEREAMKETLKEWREALTQAANLSGHYLNNGHEAKFIRKIVDENIWEWRPSTNEYLHVATHPVGIDSRVQPIISDLSSCGSNDVKMLVSNILKPTTKFQINSVDAGIGVIKQHLRRRIVLLVIDDVETVGQLNAIVGNRDWFGPGNIILITRYEHLLNQWKVNMRYPAWVMNEEEALELFSWHAFGNSLPNEEYHELSKKVVSYCGGLPLALEVLGSLLMGRTITEWESKLEKLKRGTEENEVVTLDLPSSKKASFRTNAFAGMKKLRLLQLSNVELTGNFKHFTKELRWLCWQGFPFKSMPKHLLNQPKLVALDLRFSQLRQGWKNSKPLEMLKILISVVPGNSVSRKSVKTLYFTYCWRLRELPEGLGEMVELRKVRAHDIGITQIPSSIMRLTNLRELILSNCNLIEDVHLKNLGSLISLKDLDLGSNSCRSLPSLSGFSNLVNLTLDLCRNLRAIPSLPTNLESLSAIGCHALETMPDFSQMSNMRALYLTDSPKVREVPGLGLDISLNSMAWLCMKGCTNLTAEFRDNILQRWASCGSGGIYLDEIYDIPEWFEFVADGNKVSFDVHQCDGRNFKGLTLCCVYSKIKENYHPLDIIVVNCTKHTTSRAFWPSWGSLEDYFWQGQLSNDKLKLSLQDGDKIVILLEGFRTRPKKTGVNLVWAKPLKENMHGSPDYMYTSESEPHPDWLYDESVQDQAMTTTRDETK
ncbi:unnamed protein product [Malus baccata var. baccata]